jgi:predicted MFS family arabinose efflux permease
MFSTFFQLYKQAFSGLSRNSWLLSIVMLINRSGTMVVAFMTVYCEHQLHFSPVQAGSIMALFGVGALCGGFIGGQLTDKIGFYDIQVWALVTGGLLFMALGFLHTFAALALGAFVLSLFNESVRPANSAAIVHYSLPQNKTRSVSLNRLAINIGWALGGLVGGLLAAINYRLLFWVDGGTNILAAVLLVILMPKAGIVKSIKKTDKGPARSSAYADHTYLLFLVLGICYFICFYEFMIIEPAFYKLAWHFNLRFIGVLMALNGLLIALFEMVLIHNLEGKRHGLAYIIAGIATGAIGFVLLNLLPPGALVAIFIVVLITVSEMLSMPFMSSFWMGRSKDHNRGQYAALYSMSWSTAQVAAPFVGGLIIASGGFSALWWVLAGLSAIATVGYFFLHKSQRTSRVS